MNLNQLKEQVKADDIGKKDFEVESKDLRMDEGKVRIGSEFFQLTDWSGYLQSQKMLPGMQWGAIRKLPKDLISDLFNWGFENNNGEYRVRVKRDPTGEKFVRGYVSKKDYVPFMNKDVVDGMIMNMGGDYPVHRYHLDDKFFWVRVLLPDCDFAINGKKFHVGFTSYNSEVAYRALSGSGFIHTLACLNDLQMVESTEMKLRHIGHPIEEMAEALARSINQIKGMSSLYQEKIEVAAKTAVPEDQIDPTFKFVSKSLRISDKRMKCIRKIFDLTGDVTKMGIANAITNFCHSLPGAQRIFLETSAAKVIDSKLPFEK